MVIRQDGNKDAETGPGSHNELCKTDREHTGYTHKENLDTGWAINTGETHQGRAEDHTGGKVTGRGDFNVIRQVLTK